MKRKPSRSPLKPVRNWFHHPKSFLTRLDKPGFFMARPESIRQSMPLLGLRYLSDELQLKESSHVVQNAQRLRDIRIVRRAHRIKPHSAEAIDRILKREAVLKGNAESPAKTLN